MKELNLIRNIYCVGRNYRAHAAELGNEVPSEPMLFGKPTHALCAMDGGEIVLPADKGEIHHEAELVIRIARPYSPELSLDQLIDGMALGIDFTLRDLQSKLKSKGQPWLAAKGFLRSAPISSFRPFPGEDKLAKAEFKLLVSGRLAQHGHVADMIFPVRQLLEYTSRHYGLGGGDILFTGTPEGVGPVAQGDKLELLWGEELWGKLRVNLA
jgi:2-keto-4-pentenoate hydratase/2-oxohepta-3-ene-1,7-dioic acid hydratase in catechol pathway